MPHFSVCSDHGFVCSLGGDQSTYSWALIATAWRLRNPCKPNIFQQFFFFLIYLKKKKKKECQKTNKQGHHALNISAAFLLNKHLNQVFSYQNNVLFL